MTTPPPADAALLRECAKDEDHLARGNPVLRGCAVHSRRAQMLRALADLLPTLAAMEGALDDAADLIHEHVLTPEERAEGARMAISDTLRRYAETLRSLGASRQPPRAGRGRG